MVQDRRILKVFVASPSDVGRERAEALKVIEEINRVSQPTVGLAFEQVRWEMLPPATFSLSERRVQDLLNDLVVECDIFILILGSRYGSVGTGQKSNTELEVDSFLRRVKGRKKVYFLSYFKDIRSISDKDLQVTKANEFRKSLGEKGIFYTTFRDLPDFQNSIRADLYSILFYYLARKSPQAKTSKSPKAQHKPIEQIQKKEPSPAVFISYSHDSDNHIRWVHSLATKLVENGVDIKLDIWDLHAGDDIAEYMERNIAESHRVLIICTPNYVEKADRGIGGAGYEKTIITGEIVRNIGTKKFVPVIRAGKGDKLLPRCLSSRLYIDFRNSPSFDRSLEKLLRELYEAPEFTKPKLGKNPFV